MDLGLKGKVAVISGGSVGIGLAVAQGLAAEGVNLVLAARQTERLREAAADVAQRFGVRTLPVACDVAAPRALTSWSPRPKPPLAAPTS